MIAAYKQYKSYIDQAAAYAESFRTTEIRFNEGVINSDVYVLAKNNMDRANINLSQAKYTYIFRTKVLDYYQARLTW
jgi:outer membrane protein